MLQSSNRKCSAEYAEKFSRVELTGTRYLVFRDVPELVAKYVSPDAVTLDYGCGVGKSSAFLQSLGLHVKGVDINEDMIKCARNANANIEYELIESASIPSPDRSYDFVFSSLVFMEVGSKTELCRIMKEIARVLKPSGTFIMAVCSVDMYNADWWSVNAEFEENDLRSGGMCTVLLKDIDFTLNNYYWTDEDYRDVIKEAGLSLADMRQPIGRDDDGYAWKNEKLKPPFSIYVTKKLP